MEAQLPEITADSRRAVLILNLRQHDELGSTFLAMLQSYAENLRTHDAKLVLAEVGPHLYAQLANTGRLSTLRRRNVFRRSDLVGASIMAALDAADEWVETASPPEAPGRHDPEAAGTSPRDDGPAQDGTP
jgi:SulP family sulfate permease